MRNPVAAALLACSLAADPALADAAAPRRVTIVYTADLGGYVEPCGCSRDQRGGLARLATVLARLRAEGREVIFAAGGDLLFEEKPTPEAREQELAKARTVAEALRRMGLAFTLEGERDLFAGEAFAKATKIPFARRARVGPVAFGVPGEVPSAPVRVGVVHAGGTRAALPLADEARRGGLALLLASHRDSLVADDVNRAVLDAPVPVVQVQARGQSLARIDVTLAGDLSKPFAVLTGPAQRDEEVDLIDERKLEYGRRREAARAAGNRELDRALGLKIDELERRRRALVETPLPTPPADRPSLSVSFIPLTEDVPEDPAIRTLVARYYAEVARANLARARATAKRCPEAPPGAPVFIGIALRTAGGADGCAACHPAALAFWKRTAHARAYRTLVERGRQYDLDCVGCHVTGWKEAGGACDVARTAGREAVQCESCHGPGSLHANDPPRHIARAVPEARCKTCHTAENSTHFEYSGYLDRVIGPGHGRPSQ